MSVVDERREGVRTILVRQVVERGRTKGSGTRGEKGIYIYMAYRFNKQTFLD